MSNPTFSILITTKNRKRDLEITLETLDSILCRSDVECIVFDDGSADGTYEMVSGKFPQVKLLRNEISKGLIHNRNVLLTISKGDYAVSLDDDLNFLSANPLETIACFFEKYPKCGVQSFRIYWDKQLPSSQNTNQQLVRVDSFAGGAHAFRMEAWRDIPDYPAWFRFYGEENFAAYQLFKRGWEVYYNPEVLTHHRVDLKERKKNKDYLLRYRRGLRSGWYLYFLFCPWVLLPKKLVYSLFIQIKLRFCKEYNFRVLLSMAQAMGDVLWNLLRLMKESNRLSLEEFREMSKLRKVTLYWNPNDEK